MSDFDPTEVLRRSSSGPLGGWSTVRVHRKAALPTAAIAVAARRTPQQHRTVPAVAAVAAAPDAHLGPITAPDRLEAELEKTTAVLSSARQQFSEERRQTQRAALQRERQYHHRAAHHAHELAREERSPATKPASATAAKSASAARQAAVAAIGGITSATAKRASILQLAEQVAKHSARPSTRGRTAQPAHTPTLTLTPTVTLRSPSSARPSRSSCGASRCGAPTPHSPRRCGRSAWRRCRASSRRRSPRPTSAA